MDALGSVRAETDAAGTITEQRHTVLTDGQLQVDTTRTSGGRTLVLALLLTATVAVAQTPAAPPGTIEYYHVDALGSVRAVTDASGAVVRSYHYHAFGEGVGVEAGTDPMRFTGKPRDGETGLDYFGARYYAPRMGGSRAWIPPSLSPKLSLILRFGTVTRT